MDKITENYEKSLNELSDIKGHNELKESLTPNDIKLIGIVEKTLASDTLYLENTATEDILVLSKKTNKNIFEAIKASAHDLLYVGEAFDETPQDAEPNGNPYTKGSADKDGSSDKENGFIPGDEHEENNAHDQENMDAGVQEAHDADPEEGAEEGQGDSNDVGSADEDELHPQMKPQNEAEEDDEDEEEMDEKDKDEVEESLMGVLQAPTFIVRSDLKQEGWLLNQTTPYFAVVQEAVVGQLAAICEAFGDKDVFETFLQNFSSIQEQGMGIAEVEAAAPTKGVIRKAADAVKALPGKVKDAIKAHPKTAKVVAATGLAAGGAYAGKKYLDKISHEVDKDGNQVHSKSEVRNWAARNWAGGTKGKAKVAAAGVAAGAGVAGAGVAAHKAVKAAAPKVKAAYHAGKALVVKAGQKVMANKGKAALAVAGTGAAAYGVHKGIKAYKAKKAAQESTQVERKELRETTWGQYGKSVGRSLVGTVTGKSGDRVIKGGRMAAAKVLGKTLGRNWGKTALVAGVGAGVAGAAKKKYEVKKQLKAQNEGVGKALAIGAGAYGAYRIGKRLAKFIPGVGPSKEQLKAVEAKKK